MNDWIENEPNPAHPLRFLVVESSLGARILIRMHLLELKHWVDMAWDEESAIDLSCLRAYDFILLDKNLNCFELIDRIQNNSIFNEHTPIVVLTPISNGENPSQSNVIYFKKPISKMDALELLNCLKSIKK
ncbi:TPA: response regulator [Legionella pneumophila]